MLCRQNLYQGVADRRKKVYLHAVEYIDGAPVSLSRLVPNCFIYFIKYSSIET